MNSPTITMEKEAALAKLEEYERAAEKNPHAVGRTEKAILQGYRVLARGGRLIEVNEALKHGGTNLAGLPKLAMARAHAERVRFRSEWSGIGGVFAWDQRAMWDRRFRSDKYLWPIPLGTFETFPKERYKEYEALTPIIPLPLRPRHALDNYFILWEANWFPAPPVDPYLLRPVTGSLMEILAEWHLTPLEVAAVRGAMRR